MRDHVHLLAFAHRRDSLSNAIGRTHMRYSRWLNGRHGTGGGEVWSNRFDSSLLAPERWWTVARYVERNPVRAGRVERAESYPWSSAHVHASGGHHPLLAASRPFPGEIADWSAWLEQPVDPEAAAELRRQTSTGRPTGSLDFIRGIEQAVGRRLRPRKRGRKPRREKAPPSLAREVSRGDSIALL